MNFENNIKKAYSLFKTIFCDVETSLNFLKKINFEKNYQTFFDDKQNLNIKHAMDLLIENAKVKNDRHLQQKYFMNTLTEMNNQDVKTSFVSNEQFRTNYLMLFFVFKCGFHNEEELKNAHHTEIIRLIDDSYKRIIM